MMGPRTATLARSRGTTAANRVRCEISPGPRAHPEPKPYLLACSPMGGRGFSCLPAALAIGMCEKKKLYRSKIMLCDTCSSPLPLALRTTVDREPVYQRAPLLIFSNLASAEPACRRCRGSKTRMVRIASYLAVPVGSTFDGHSTQHVLIVHSCFAKETVPD